MTVKERLLEFIEYKNLNASRFQKTIGVSSSYVNNMGDGISSAAVMAIERVYPELNIEWLKKGTGEMLNKNFEMPIAQTINLVPLSSQFNSLDDFVGEPTTPLGCEKIISPIYCADVAMKVTNDCMAPQYPTGSIVLLRKTNEKAFIDWGKVYVLDTCNGIIMKRVLPSNSKDSVKCENIDKVFPPFEIKRSDINGWWAVLMVMINK